MSSLYIVGYGKENYKAFIDYFKAKIKAYIKQYNLCFYNSDTIWKAEANIDRLKKNSRFILPTDQDKTVAYCGVINNNDWDGLYSKFFSSLEYEHDKSPINQYTYYYSFSRLKLLFQYFKQSTYEKSRLLSDDFSIEYNNKLISDCGKMCVIKIDINYTWVDDYELFYRLVSEFDNLFPKEFLSAYIDNEPEEFDRIKYNYHMLTEKIIDTGNAFYVSKNLISHSKISDISTLQDYNISNLENGYWFKPVNPDKRVNSSLSQLNDLLIPHYALRGWSELIAQKYLRLDAFDTVSVYYDRYCPTNPSILLSRGYMDEQIDCIAKIYGIEDLQARYPISYLLLDS